MKISDFKIEPTQNTPEVILDPSGIIKISGRSMTVCSLSFIASIDEWLEKYTGNPAENTNIIIELEYLNNANIKPYSSLLQKLNTLRIKNKKFTINWVYEEGDEDIYEKGELLSSLLKYPFNFVIREETIYPVLKCRETDLPKRAFA
jgi:hypothetical protein